MRLDKCSSLQTRGEAAASQLILYHYPELKEEKGIVLMTAEMDSTFLVRINCTSVDLPGSPESNILQRNSGEAKFEIPTCICFLLKVDNNRSCSISSKLKLVQILSHFFTISKSKRSESIMHLSKILTSKYIRP